MMWLKLVTLLIFVRRAKARREVLALEDTWQIWMIPF